MLNSRRRGSDGSGMSPNPGIAPPLSSARLTAIIEETDAAKARAADILARIDLVLDSGLGDDESAHRRSALGSTG